MPSDVREKPMDWGVAETARGLGAATTLTPAADLMG